VRDPQKQGTRGCTMPVGTEKVGLGQCGSYGGHYVVKIHPQKNVNKVVLMMICRGVVLF
jgi:hypothetical protein